MINLKDKVEDKSKNDIPPIKWLKKDPLDWFLSYMSENNRTWCGKITLFIVSRTNCSLFHTPILTLYICTV